MTYATLGAVRDGMPAILLILAISGQDNSTPKRQERRKKLSSVDDLAGLSVVACLGGMFSSIKFVRLTVKSLV